MGAVVSVKLAWTAERIRTSSRQFAERFSGRRSGREQKSSQDSELSSSEVSIQVAGSSAVAAFPPECYVSNVRTVLTSKFVLMQVAFNVLASFVGPLGSFFLLFGFLSQGPYEWNGPQLCGVVVGSLACSPLLIFALMPVGMPEALDKRWFYAIRLSACPAWLRCMLPYLGTHGCWKWAAARHIMLGLIVGVVYVPITLLIARYAVGPTLDTWTLIWFNVTYEIFLAVPITMLGCLGYAVEHHLANVKMRMSDHPKPVVRVLRRAGTSIKMIVWPW